MGLDLKKATPTIAEKALMELPVGPKVNKSNNYNDLFIIRHVFRPHLKLNEHSLFHTIFLSLFFRPNDRGQKRNLMIVQMRIEI
jgi:hypothetical protein